MFAPDIRSGVDNVEPGDGRTSILRSDVGPNMLHVSDILIERHDLESFAELVHAVRTRAARNGSFASM